MIDLHTHLLPNWDDGAVDPAESDRMIEEARKDGIAQIALTPHVYRMAKPGNDAARLKSRIRSYLNEPKPKGVDLFPGAEVHVHPDMISHIKEFELTVNGSHYVFIEFSSQSVPGEASGLIYRMMLAGLIPIISHPERNGEIMRSPETLYVLVLQGALVQITGQSLLGGFGARVRKTAEGLLKHGIVHLIASDAHDASKRPPRLSRAVHQAAKFVGTDKAVAMVTQVPRAVLDDQEIPDLGEPTNPAKSHRRFYSLT